MADLTLEAVQPPVGQELAEGQTQWEELKELEDKQQETTKKTIRVEGNIPKDIVAMPEKENKQKQTGLKATSTPPPGTLW